VSEFPPVGISGLAAYVPPYRVCLEEWSEWTGNNPDKIRAVVGSSFRMRGSEQSVYTLAATAVLRLIRNYGLDPSRVSYLGFGTESSTDNAAGAVIIKGMVNDGLRALGKPALPRECEVPEFKHACLGGVYAMKGALRYLATDGAGRQAIVVSSDLAQYARGSSGEQTQGAGAVAMLLEEDPKLATVDLRAAGKSSDYRGADFRKPFIRFNQTAPGHHGHLNDFPVFNGPYSTACYLEATIAALGAMFEKADARPSSWLKDLGAIFMHRPYQRMPESGLALGYLFALSRGDETDRTELSAHCEAAGECTDAVIEELGARPAIGEAAEDPARPSPEAYPRAMNVVRALRSTDAYRDVVTGKLAFGADLVAELGNLYTASLPAWIAAGFEDAAESGEDLTDHRLLLIGYGSGDAAEAIPCQVVPGWEAAARKIRMSEALADPIGLDRDQYERLHDGRQVEIARSMSEEFVVSHVGDRVDAPVVDEGIEYYRFIA
jgi:hydroxymethylglutaryl-CoA synthase